MVQTYNHNKALWIHERFSWGIRVRNIQPLALQLGIVCFADCSFYSLQLSFIYGRTCRPLRSQCFCHLWPCLDSGGFIPERIVLPAWAWSFGCHHSVPTVLQEGDWGDMFKRGDLPSLSFFPSCVVWGLDLISVLLKPLLVTYNITHRLGDAVA